MTGKCSEKKNGINVARNQKGEWEELKEYRHKKRGTHCENETTFYIGIDTEASTTITQG